MRTITNKPGYLFFLLFSVTLISCATITVNVYFPAEEVKQAYTNLEEEFLLEDIQDSNDTTSPQASPPPGSSIRELYESEPTITSRVSLILILLTRHLPRKILQGP